MLFRTNIATVMLTYCPRFLSCNVTEHGLNTTYECRGLHLQRSVSHQERSALRSIIGRGMHVGHAAYPCTRISRLRRECIALHERVGFGWQSMLFVLSVRLNPATSVPAISGRHLIAPARVSTGVVYTWCILLLLFTRKHRRSH